MATEKQIDANRQNALKSSGPKTVEGKARSKYNAVKHALYSANVYIHPDEQTEYAQLERAYLEHYNPQDHCHRDKILLALSLRWRLRRCARIETELLLLHGHEREKDEFFFAGPGYGFNHDAATHRAIPSLSAIEARLFKQYTQMAKELEALRSKGREASSPANSSGVPST